MLWVISDNMSKFNQIMGSSTLSPAHGLGGARATIFFFIRSRRPLVKNSGRPRPP